jgi:hypothetical protein
VTGSRFSFFFKANIEKIYSSKNNYNIFLIRKCYKVFSALGFQAFQRNPPALLFQIIKFLNFFWALLYPFESVSATLILRICIGGERAGSSVHEDQDPVLQPGAAAGGDQAVLHQGEDTRQCAPLIQVISRRLSRISFSVGDP